ncbi:hypothetical protein DFH29DRAFT_1014762, partial [Suillus ampliporus]
RWYTLLDDVKRLLGSGDMREVGAGVIAALKCVRAFRYTRRLEIPAMLHLILKTHKTTIIVNLSLHQQSPESLVPWGRLLFRIVEMSFPAE